MAYGILINIYSGNGLLPVQHQDITRTNADLVLVGVIETNPGEFKSKYNNFY